jgi:transcriptional regulator with XRE-family HTH domain
VIRVSKEGRRVIDPARLGPKLKERREREGWSLRRAAVETGVSFATIARVEAGNVPDLDTYRKLAAFLGVATKDGIEAAEVPENTIEAIANHLRHDPALRPEDAARISQLVQSMYEALARPTAASAVHLRSASTFKPLAATLLGELVDDMRTALEAGDAA